MKSSIHQTSHSQINFHGLKIPVEDLYSHTLITGRPGSGKSRCCVRPLLRELVTLNASNPELKTGMLLLDGKGGELREYLGEALDQAGRSKDLVVVGPTNATFNFMETQIPDVKIANQLIAAANFLGEGNSGKRNPDPFWDHALRDILTALVAVAKHLHTHIKCKEPFSIEHIVRLRSLLTQSNKSMAKEAAALAKVVGGDAGTSLKEFAALPDSTRQCVATSVGALLAPFGRPPLKDVLIPQAGRPELALASIINEGKVVLLDLADAESAVELLPAAVLLKSSFARFILSRRKLPINQVRPVFVVMEEFQKMMTPQAESPACEANWMDTCRWCGCGVILCTQGISSLLATASQPLVDKIASLCATQMWLGSTDPASATYAARSLGRKLVHRQHHNINQPIPAPLIFPREDVVPGRNDSHVLVPAFEPVLAAEELAMLPPGEIHLRLRNGQVKALKTDVAAD